MLTLSGKQILTGRLTAISLFTFVMLFLVMAPGLRAQTVECTEEDIGERIKCKHGKLLGEQKKVIDNLEVSFGGVVPAGDFERLRKAHGRAKKSNSRMDGKKFKSLGKKNPGTCAFEQYSGNANPICEPGEKCKEVIGDGIGDEDGICKLKGKKKEVCVEICEGDTDVLEDDTDMEYLADLEENYDDVTKNLEDANAMMENNQVAMAAMAMPLLTSYEPSAACAASIDWLTYGEVLTMTIMKQISVGLRGIADIAERGCDQTGAGFNCATCCIVAEGAASVMALVVETTDGIFKLVKWGFDNASQSCLGSLSADLQETKAVLKTVAITTGKSDAKLTGVVMDVQYIRTTVDNLTTAVGNVQQQITNLEGAMNTRFNKVDTLLITPQGKRDGFPSK
jgi:hypothetical protein